MTGHGPTKLVLGEQPRQLVERDGAGFENPIAEAPKSEAVSPPLALGLVEGLEGPVAEKVRSELEG